MHQLLGVNTITMSLCQSHCASQTLTYLKCLILSTIGDHFQFNVTLAISSNLLRLNDPFLSSIFRYDFYLQTSQLSKELPYVLLKLGLKIPESKRKIFLNSHSETKNQRKKAAVEGLQASTYVKMVERFRDDFEVFGYPIPSFEEFKQKYAEDEDK